jgi:hypothetical protein
MDRRSFLPVLACRAQVFLHKEASLVRYESFLNLRQSAELHAQTARLWLQLKHYYLLIC